MPHLHRDASQSPCRPENNSPKAPADPCCAVRRVYYSTGVRRTQPLTPPTPSASQTAHHPTAKSCSSAYPTGDATTPHPARYPPSSVPLPCAAFQGRVYYCPSRVMLPLRISSHQHRRETVSLARQPHYSD